MKQVIHKTRRNPLAVLGTVAALGISTLGVFGTTQANAAEHRYNAPVVSRDRGNDNNRNFRNDRDDHSFNQPNFRQDRNDYQFRGDRYDNRGYDAGRYDNRRYDDRRYDDRRYDDRGNDTGKILGAGILGAILGSVLTR
ncbi:MAG: hypothetical protein JO316_04805 [Abitibacteriaceae bacterium]|nr:hypothetical protein [Abditibacteriaceae bacterium]